MFDSGRLTVAWEPVDGQMRKSVRRAFLAIQCLESAMPYGGQINVSSSRTSRKISGQADKLGEFELVWDEPASTKISAAHVQFVLLKNALLTDSLEIHVTQTSNEITIQF
jgi:histidine phosphotransferase ChpT